MFNAVGTDFTQPYFLYTERSVHPQREMAVGLFSEKEAPADSHSHSSDDRKVTKPEKSYDAEAGLGGPSASRDSDDASLAIGKQIAMEAGNGIRYRTCSWPKVCDPPNVRCTTLTVIQRLPRCCLPSTFAWLSCPFRGHIRFLDSFQD